MLGREMHCDHQTSPPCRLLPAATENTFSVDSSVLNLLLTTTKNNKKISYRKQIARQYSSLSPGMSMRNGAITINVLVSEARKLRITLGSGGPCKS